MAKKLIKSIKPEEFKKLIKNTPDKRDKVAFREEPKKAENRKEEWNRSIQEELGRFGYHNSLRVKGNG